MLAGGGEGARGRRSKGAKGRGGEGAIGRGSEGAIGRDWLYLLMARINGAIFIKLGRAPTMEITFITITYYLETI